MTTKTMTLKNIIASLDDSEQDVELTFDYLKIPKRKAGRFSNVVKTLAVINDGYFDYSHDMPGTFNTKYYYNVVVTGDGFAVKHFLKDLISL